VTRTPDAARPQPMPAEPRATAVEVRRPERPWSILDSAPATRLPRRIAPQGLCRDRGVALLRDHHGPVGIRRQDMRGGLALVGASRTGKTSVLCRSVRADAIDRDCALVVLTQRSADAIKALSMVPPDRLVHYLSLARPEIGFDAPLADGDERAHPELAADALERIVRHPIHLSFDELLRGREILIVDSGLEALGRESCRVLVQLLLGAVTTAVERQVKAASEQVRLAIKLDDAHLVADRRLTRTIRSLRAAGAEIVVAAQYGQSPADHAVTDELLRGVEHWSLFSAERSGERQRAIEIPRDLTPQISAETIRRLTSHEVVSSWVSGDERMATFTAQSIPVTVDQRVVAAHLETQHARRADVPASRGEPSPKVNAKTRARIQTGLKDLRASEEPATPHSVRGARAELPAARTRAIQPRGADLSRSRSAATDRRGDVKGRSVRARRGSSAVSITRAGATASRDDARSQAGSREHRKVARQLESAKLELRRAEEDEVPPQARVQPDERRRGGAVVLDESYRGRRKRRSDRATSAAHASGWQPMMLLVGAVVFVLVLSTVSVIAGTAAIEKRLPAGPGGTHLPIPFPIPLPLPVEPPVAPPPVVPPVVTPPSTPGQPSKPGTPARWPTTLEAGQSLTAGQELESANGRYFVVMQADGNVVVQDSRTAIWSTKTTGESGAALHLQTDGKLVVRNTAGKDVWRKDTSPSHHDTLTIEDDGNLVLYNADPMPLWSSKGGFNEAPCSNTFTKLRGLPLTVTTLIPSTAVSGLKGVCYGSESGEGNGSSGSASCGTCTVAYEPPGTGGPGVVVSAVARRSVNSNGQVTASVASDTTGTAQQLANVAIPGQYIPVIAAAAATLDVNPYLLASVAFQESRFQPEGINSSGCAGIMQIGVGGACGDTWDSSVTLEDANGMGTGSVIVHDAYTLGTRPASAGPAPATPDLNDPFDAIMAGAVVLRGKVGGVPIPNLDATAYRALCGYYGACADAVANYAADVFTRAQQWQSSGGLTAGSSVQPAGYTSSAGTTTAANELARLLPTVTDAELAHLTSADLTNGLNTLKAALAGSPSAVPSDYPITAPTPAAAAALAFAMAQIGRPYLWGGTGPNAFDCSGLVQAAYRSAGIELPRVAQDQYDAGPHLPLGAPLQPGDLVFFGTSATNVTHVGMVVSAGGTDAVMVDAPHTGAYVRQEPFPTTVGAAWGSDVYLGATRPASAIVRSA
jgi:cell wall-associated NlpC family hydrolase